MSLGMLGKYERLDILGHGASGIVYLAQDTLIKRRVAIKEINAQGEERQRVLEEATVLDRLRHPNIVAVNGVDIISGKVVIDMEYIQGSNLLDILRESEGSLPMVLSLDIAAQICDGLAYAHSRRTVHRDIKPANILLSEDYKVKLVDFGLAQVLGTNSYAGGAGTFAYMAPEDFDEGGRSDHQSDIWALGIILYEMLTGFRPFVVTNARDPFAWSRAIANDEIKPPSFYETEIPLELDEICLTILQRDKSLRYSDAAEIAVDLRAVLTEMNPLQDAEAPETLLDCLDIDDFLNCAPAKWPELSAKLANGSLAKWLNKIGEPLLAEVATDLADGDEETMDDRLRVFLYRAGLDLDVIAKEDARAGADLIDEGRYVEAVEALQRAVCLDPARPSYCRLLAQAAHYANDTEIEQAAMHTAHQLRPFDRIAHYKLPEAYHRLGWHLLCFCELPLVVSFAKVVFSDSTGQEGVLFSAGLLASGLLSACFLALVFAGEYPIPLKVASAFGAMLSIFGVVTAFHSGSLSWNLLRLPIEVLIVSLIIPVSQLYAYLNGPQFLRKPQIWRAAFAIIVLIDCVLIWRASPT